MEYFALFIRTLAADARKYPEKLKIPKDVWDQEREKLLENVSDTPQAKKKNTA